MKEEISLSACTLFEGNYDKGVAVLANSLYANGYRGTFYVGYRGNLPTWADQSADEACVSWTNGRKLKIASDFELLFLPLKTTDHLTNHKPDFMLELFEKILPKGGGLFYFDPDIVINKRWVYFKDWLECGIALCEDVNSPLPQFHPKRIGWRKYFGAFSFDLRFKGTEYVNGGAVGISNQNTRFLTIWKKLNGLMGQSIGGLSVTKISGGSRFESKGFGDCFEVADQDALNASVEAYGQPVSIQSRSAMGFYPGETLLPHALGQRKPWTAGYLHDCLKGIPPRMVDKLFWKHASGPVSIFEPRRITTTRLFISVASLIGRFYRKS